jgi:NAD-dependent dihydropyrimidine dehydrogenase PreA subunit
MSRHHRTRFVEFDLHRCRACRACVEACPWQVLGMVAFFRHRHVHVDHADRCRGCRACAAACPHGAIRRLDDGRGDATTTVASGCAGSQP